MSESISAPADAPAPTQGPGEGAPPPALQEPISLTEAARRLARRGAEARAQSRGQTETTGQPVMAPTAPQPVSHETSAADMAAALGLPPGQPPPEAPTADGYELDGRRYSSQELQRLVAAGQDYTRKTQALAEQQRAFAAQQEALASVIPYIQPELERLQQQIQAVQRPDQTLAETNPQEYLRQLAAFEAMRGSQERLQALQALNQQAMTNAMQRAVEQSNAKLAEQFPQWANPETRTQWQQAIAEWAMEKGGYGKDELRGLTDHRHLITMMKAMQWDRMLAGARTSAPVPQVQTVIRGAPPPLPASVQVQDAQSAFENRPNFRTGAALLAARRGTPR